MHQETEDEFPKPAKRFDLWIDLSIVVIVFTLSVAAFWIFKAH